MEYALRLREVSKHYRHSEFALDQVSFALPKGAVMGFVGENGAGKTTTIGCILNTLKRDGGQIEIFGREMNDEDTDIREKIGIVYDGDNFPGYFTAKQIGRVMEGVYKSWDNGMFYEYLRRFRLNDGQKISEYSKGMTMKLAVAAALSHQPELLILDEATSGLDPVMREEMLDIFLDFVGDENHSILMSSHITGDLEKIADYITFIHNGRIILAETKDQLIYNYGVLRCREKDYEMIDKKDILGWRRRDYQVDVLVSDFKKVAKKYPQMVLDHTTVDEILLILTKGERHEGTIEK